MSWLVIFALTLTAPLAQAAGSTGATPQAKPVIVVLETEQGTIEIEVDTVHAPISSANFLKYVDAGLYDAGAFFRTVRPDTETNTQSPIAVVQARRASGKPGFPAIALERTSVTGLKHLDGTVSMARSGPDTATSDIFICVGNQPSLDYAGGRNADGQGFAAFGKVLSGMDVVKKIQAAPVRPSTQMLDPTIAIVKARRKS